MTREESHYFELLMVLDAAVSTLQGVIDDHEECPGCELCIEAAGMEYGVRSYFDRVLSYAPPDSISRLKRETECDPKELAAYMAGIDPYSQPPSPDAPVVVCAEASSATEQADLTN